jgi:hypothetical protein
MYHVLDASTHHVAFERRHTVLLFPRHVTHVDVRGTASFKPSRGNCDRNAIAGPDDQGSESTGTGLAVPGRESIEVAFSSRLRVAHPFAGDRSGNIAVRASAFVSSSLLPAGPRFASRRLSEPDRARASALIEPRVPGRSAGPRKPLPLCPQTALTPRRHQQAGRIHDEGVH